MSPRGRRGDSADRRLELLTNNNWIRALTYASDKALAARKHACSCIPTARRLLTTYSMNVGDPDGANSSRAMLTSAWIIKRRFDLTEKPIRYVTHLLRYDSPPASRFIPSVQLMYLSFQQDPDRH